MGRLFGNNTKKFFRQLLANVISNYFFNTFILTITAAFSGEIRLLVGKDNWTMNALYSVIKFYFHEICSEVFGKYLEKYDVLINNLKNSPKSMEIIYAVRHGYFGVGFYVEGKKIFFIS